MPEPDGMATLSAYLLAADAVGVFAVLDEHARRAGSPDDERTMDARRGDALVDLVLDPTGYCSAGTKAAQEHTNKPDQIVAATGTGGLAGWLPLPVRAMQTRRRGRCESHHSLHRAVGR